MKTLSLLLLLVGFAAHAQTETSAPVACYQKAEQELVNADGSAKLSITGLIWLCSNTKVAGAPVECFKNAEKELSQKLSLTGMVWLCSGAESATMPIDCYKDADKNLVDSGGNQKLSEKGKIWLCTKMREFK